MFTSVAIKNLRGIENLRIDELSRINVFVGPNNCGKTTVLEAIFLLVGMSNPRLLVTINNLRGLVVNERNDLRFIFRDFDIGIPIEVEGTNTVDGNRNLRIEPIISSMVQPATSRGQLPVGAGRGGADTVVADSTTSDELSGLKVSFRSGRSRDQGFESRIVAETDGLKLGKDSTYTEHLQGRFYNNASLTADLAERIDQVQKAKKKPELIAVLQRIDPSVVDIALSTGDLVYVDIGISQLVPINLLGDGFRKACALVSNLLVLKEGYLLVDEIETGLHRDSLKVVWKSMLEASHKYNSQLFLATHSYEAISSLLRTVEENDYPSSDITLFSIQRTPSGDHKAYAYAYENLEAMIESQADFRGRQLIR